MALDINGYNATFRAFTEFATQAVNAGKSNAIARVGEGDGSLAGRVITAAKGDFIGNVGRFSANVDANNVARNLFRKAISDMFGGPNKIPESVIDAMKMQDFDRGKPLTARRIIAVKNAIDSNGVLRDMVAKQAAAEQAKQAAFDESISVFKNADTEQAALEKGYTKGELPKLAKAVNLLVQTTGCSEADALKEVTATGSKANRLMKYGGRFLQSVDNFKNGLRLLDAYETWFNETEARMKSMSHGRDMIYEDGMSKTLLNAQSTTFSADRKRPLERFVFDELANNRSMDLAETDAEKLFGLENNKASSFIARGFHLSRTQTLIQIPPEKRTLFFKAMDILCPPYASNAKEASVPSWERTSLKSAMLDAPMARVIMNFDKLAELDAKGELNQANLVKLCFPEIPEPGDNPQADVIDLINRWDDEVGEKGYNSIIITDVMKSTGCSLEDAFDIVDGKKQMPNIPYYSSGTMGIEQLGGSVEGARNQLVGDLDRPDGYKYNGKAMVLKEPGFRFNFPGGESLLANKSEAGKANIPKIADKLEALCGDIHREQAASLLMMTCQAGLAPLLGGLKSHGIETTEHTAIDFTISRNETTGDISIRYSSPEDLPFAFEWTSTIKPDGFISTTPLKFTDEATLAAQKREQAPVDGKQKFDTAPVADKMRKDIKAFKFDAEKFDKALEAMLSAASDDSDMLAMLTMHTPSVGMCVMLNGASQIRSPEKVVKMIADLKANLNELRAAAKGNQRVFDVGLRHIANFGGTAIKNGILTKMCDMIAKEDLGAFSNVSASSSPEKIFDAMCRLDRLVAKIFDETEIMMNIGEVGAGESTTAKGLVMGLIFAHCDEATVNGLKDALNSDNGMQLMSVLRDMGEGKFPPGAKVEPQTRIAISDYADVFQMSFRHEMYGALNDALGIGEVDMLGGLEGEPSISPESANAILDTIEEYTLEMEERRRSRPNLADLPPQAAQ